MNGPVVAGHSAAVQQGLFNRLNGRRADGAASQPQTFSSCCLNDASSTRPQRPRDEGRTQKRRGRGIKFGEQIQREITGRRISSSQMAFHIYPHCLLVLACQLFDPFCCPAVTVGSLGVRLVALLNFKAPSVASVTFTPSASRRSPCKPRGNSAPV